MEGSFLINNYAKITNSEVIVKNKGNKRILKLDEVVEVGIAVQFDSGDDLVIYFCSKHIDYVESQAVEKTTALYVPYCKKLHRYLKSLGYDISHEEMYLL